MIIEFTKLNSQDQKLIKIAKNAMSNGYDPYSNFFVGSALLTNNGSIYKGANLNTCSYLGLCAERNAIGNAITNGDYNFKTIAIISKSDFFDVNELSGPCGICRQMLWEFSELIDKDIKILSSDSKMKKILVTSIRKLHPYGFGPRLGGGKIDKYLSKRD